MRKKSGFSVIELLVVIGMIAIICSIAVPNLIGWRNKAQLGRAARDLYGSFQKAKMEAARNNQYCAVSFGDVVVGGKTYDYVVYMDDSTDPPNLEYDAGERVITTRTWSEYPGVSDTAITFPVVNTKPTIAFAPDGLPKNGAGGLIEGSVTLRNQGVLEREISISLVGNIKIEQ
jgi:prepilin-type N-terminal cleavage/methylation domain-containing protein